MNTSLVNRTSRRRSKHQKRRSFLGGWQTKSDERFGRRLRVEQLEDRRVLAIFAGGAITINDDAVATPYPSNINVSLPTVNASVVDVNLTLNNLNHTFPDDIDVLLVGPTLANAIVMSDVGSDADAVGVNLTLDDEAGGGLPDAGPLVSGSFQPTNIGAGDVFPAPAPAPTGGSALTAFDATDPEGTWSLYVVDDFVGDTGAINGGWTLNIQLGGAVVVTAGGAANDAVADTFLVRRSGANLQILVNAVIVFDEPFAGVTSLTVNGSNDNDSLTVDFAGGDPLPGGTLAYNAGGGTADSMTLQGGSFNTVRHFFTNSTDGSVEFDGDTTDNGGAAETSVTYTGLDPIADNLNAVNRVFDFGAGNDQDVVVRDDAVAGNGLNVIEAPANAESVTFTNPTGSMTVNLGAGNDILELRRLDSTWAAPTINLNGQDDIDEIRIAATPAVATTNSDTGNGVPDDRTIVGAIVGSGGDNATDFAQFNTGVSTLDFILGVVSVSDFGGVGELYVDDSGDAGADNVTFTSSSITGAAPAAINYNGASLNIVQLALGSGADIVAVQSTGADDFGAGNGTTIFGNGGNDQFTISGDNLSGNNLFRGDGGNDTFTLNITTHLGSGAVGYAPLASLTINGNDPAASSENRDRLNINDNNAAFARNLNFDHLDTAGDLDILANAAGAGYAGPVNAALAVNVRGMETIVTTSTSDNDTVRITGTSADDLLTAVPRNSGQALVFLNGNPYLTTPPDSLATFLPGLAGGGRGPDLSLDGITGSLTLDGGAIVGEGNRAVVQGVSESNIVTGGALNIFGFGAGVLIPGAGAGNAYDTINVTDSLVTINNIVQGPLTSVALVTASFNQTTPDTPFQRAGLIVNGGDEAVAQPSGIADNITALVSPVFNIQVNGNLPTLVLGPDGLPRGDQLNITGPGDINIFSDKATPPNVTVTFSGNPGPFGVRHSSIERLALDAGTPPASGAVNLIGDNNNPAVDQNDNFVVRGRDIDGNLLDAGYQEMTVSINGSAPILINGVQRLDVLGDDAALTPSVGPNDIDTLDIRAYADNAGNPPNNAPRGWGVDVFFNEGNPPGTDGAQQDLLIYHTSAGLGGGGSVSEDVNIVPVAPDNGEVRATNQVDGSIIVVIQYVANTDIVYVDDDGSPSDNDTLTLRGAAPNLPATSGNEFVVANWNAAGDAANPKITVRDGAAAGPILYRLRNFTGLDWPVIAMGDGNDNIDLNGSLPSTLVVDGGADNDTMNAADMTTAVILLGGAGDDALTGGTGDDRLEGGTGRDTLAGGTGANRLLGGDEADEFTIAGNDTADGGDGDDRFNVPAGAGLTVNIDGGNPSASDSLFYTAAAGPETVTIDPNSTDATKQDLISSLGGTMLISGVEQIVYLGSGGDDTLIVTPGPVGQSRTQNAPDDQRGRITSDTLPIIEWNALGTFRLAHGGVTSTRVDTFVLEDLFDATTFEYSGNNDTLVIEGGASASNWSIVRVGGNLEITSATGLGVRELNVLPGLPDQIVFNTLGGNDVLNVDNSGGLITVPLLFNGGAGSDRLNLIGTTAITTSTYTPGATNDSGVVTHVLAAETQTVSFTGLEPVLDVVVAASLVVNGTNGNNAINYTGDTEVISDITTNTGVVSVDGFETIEFANKANLTINGLAGSDTINLNNPTTPVGLTGITVNGGDPTASDSVVVNGTTAGETIVFTPTAADAGTVLVAALPLVTLSTVEHLTINGRGGNDTLTTATPAALSSSIEITPGTTRDSGTVQVDSLLPMAFTALGVAGQLSIADPTVGDRDRVIYNGTAADNLFRVPSSAIPAPSLELAGQISVGTTSVESYVLRGLSGDDTFEVTAVANIIIDVQGGDPGASDVLSFTSTGATILRTGASQIDDAGVAGTPDVVYSGVETINLNANGNLLTVEGAASDDDLTVTVFSATSGKVELGLAVQQSGQVAPNVAKPLINYTNITGALTVDQLGGEDTLVVVGNALTQTFIVNASAAPFDPPPAGGLVAPPSSVLIDDLNNGTSDGLVTYLNSESLEVFGLEGSDTFEVAPGAVPVFVDGGDPIGVVSGDLIRVDGAFAYVAGPEVDEGGALSGGEVVSWDHIERVQITPDADCPFLILGTNADDDITVIARDGSYDAAADGVRDFTFSVNAGPEILITNLPDIPASPDLFIDARSGDDDIVIRTPAPNDADWDVDVQVAGGPPSIGELNEGDRLVLETPNEDSIVFNPTGPDTGNIVVDEDANLLYTEASTDSRVSFGPFTFVCPDVEFTYVSSPGGVELVEYDGEDDDELDPSFNSAADIVRINAIGVTSTTTVTPAGSTQGIGSGTFVSPLSPVFHFRAFDDLTVGGAGFDHVVINTTENADIVTSDADSVIFGTSEVTLLATVEKLTLNTLGGNDNVNLDLTSPTLAKTINAGAGNDTVDLAGSVDADIFGGIGDDVLIGSPAADNIFGGAGNDVIVGGGGVDNEYGEDGNDVFGNPGATIALAIIPNGVADDPGADFMFGGDGIDQFIWEPGDGADVIQGGVDGADILRFFGGALAELFTLNPAAGAPTHFNITINAGPTVDTHGVEQIIVSGLGGADDFVVADLAPTEVESVLIDVGAGDGAGDDVRVIGRTVSDNVAITVPVAGRVNIAGLDYDVDILSVALADADTLAFEGREGNDTILSSDALNALFSPSEVVIVAGAGDDFVSGFGTMFGDAGNDTLVGGAFINEIHGGDGDDQIFGGGGADTLFGDAGEDTFVPGFDGLVDSIDGGLDFDTILVQGNSANNRIDARQGAIGEVSYEVSGIGGGDGVLGGAGTETDVIVPGSVEELEILAGSGDDLIRVAHNDSLIELGLQVFSLRFTVDGGAPGASDRLTVTDEEEGDTTIHRVGGIAGNGSYTVGALAPVVYTDIEFASLNPINPVTGGTGTDGLGTLFVFKHDPFEENNSRLNATFLGSNSAINVDPTIDPGADALFGLPGDEDWYRIVPQFNGDLDIRVFFRQQGLLLNGRAGLPGDGNLDIALYDADGAPAAIAGTVLFGTNDANDDERIRIPAVAGQTYYLRVKGAALLDTASAALNVYNVSVINTPAAVPIDLELDDVIGVATVDAAPGPTAVSFDATAVAPFTLSTVNDFYNGKDIVFTSGNLNGIRGRILDYVGASQTFVFAVGTFFAPPTAGSTFQIESADTGRSQLDNITRDTTPTIFLRVPNVINVGGVATLDDVPFNGTAPGAPPDEFIGIPFVPTALPQVVDATAPGFRVAIFVTEHGTSDQGPPNNVLAGYASPVDPVTRPGLFSFTFSPNTLIPELPVFPGTSETTSFFISARVEMIDPAQPQQAQGYGDFAESLEIVVDTQPPPVFFGLPNDPDDGLLPDSDTGLNTNPETLNDGVTSDTTPGFFGQAEADAVIRLFIDAPELGFPTGDGIFEPAIDFQIGFDVAEPFDGTNQYPNGYWQIDAVNVDLNAPPFDPIDGLRRIFVTAEDVAGNINPEVGQVVQEIEIFLDVQGPQITDVTVNAPSGDITSTDDDYNLFDPKPSTDGPTPLVNSIFIEIRDLPARVLPIFDQPAFKPDIAENPGHYLLTGDYNGIIPILDVNVFLDPAVNGQPATGRVELVFRTEGTDGVFNTSDDIGAALPDDRFTLFVNDEGIIDFAGNIGDFESNADEPHDSPPGPGEPDVLGVDGIPTGDGLPGGDFFARFTVDTRPELGVWAAGSAFLDINGNTIWDQDNEDFTNRDITHTLGYVSDDLFAGRFATDDGEGGLVDDGFDKLAAYGRVGTNIFRWLIDTDNDGVADIEVAEPAGLGINGLPVAGNFALGIAGDEVGVFTGSRWHLDTDGDFSVVDAGGSATINWAFAGHGIVGDFDGDGLDDLASWSDDTFRFDLSSIGAGGPLAGNPGLNGIIDRTFKFGFAGPGERPVAADMNQDGIEDVGLWMPARDGITPRGQAEWYFLISGVTQNDTPGGPVGNIGPTIPGTADPTPGSYLAIGDPGNSYGVASYANGRIVVDPLFPGANIVRFQPVPFGNDQYMQFGDDFALPLVGNFDPPVSSDGPINPAVNPRNPYDVNNDGNINQIDLLAIVNYLTVNGVGPAPSGGFISAPFVDVNDDLFCNSTDLLVVLNYLTQNPPIGQGGAGEGEGEGEGGTSNDAYFARLGSRGGGIGDEDDGLLDLLARG